MSAALLPHPAASPPALPAPQVLLILGIGGAVGVLGGGWVGQWCYNRRKWSMPVFIGEGQAWIGWGMQRTECSSGGVACFLSSECH